MPDRLIFSIRDLVPHADLSDRPDERDLRLHDVAQAQLRRKYRTFRPEVSLSAIVELDGREVLINGRLDGYRRAPKGIVLYEIKSVPGDPRRWQNSPLLENARWQLRLYADLARVVARAPWGDVPIADGVLCLVGESHRLSVEMVDLRASSEVLHSRLRVMLSASRSWRPEPRRVLAALRAFIAKDSLSDRPAQHEAAALLDHADQPSRILLSMPPGSGKTRIAIRYALCEAFERNLRLLWITAKARGKDEVLAELDRYRDASVPLRVLWKTTPERVCECPGPDSLCPRRLETRAELFLDPLPEFRERPSWAVEDLREYARSRSLCVHELSTTLEPSADVIVADVNYLLNPSRIFAGKSALVLDEAQHLARRIDDYSEVCLRRDDLVELLHTTPQPARKAIQTLLAAQNADEDDSRFIGHAIQTLADQTSRLPETRTLSSLRRASRSFADLSEDFALAWCRVGAGSAVVGVVVDERRTLEKAVHAHPWVLAISGSLPADEAAQHALFPGIEKFNVLEVRPSVCPPVFIIPHLVFKHPLSMADHSDAVNDLLELRGFFPPTIAVFGQNSVSNELLAMSLHVRGFTVLLDKDLGEDWSVALAVIPDFLFVALGGTLSEAVNPPSDLFSAAAILSPGYRAPDEFDLLRLAVHSGRFGVTEDEVQNAPRTEWMAEAVSRVIQAAGRLQRSPQDQKPVFLLNRDFAEPEYLRAWPRAWYPTSSQELVYSSITEALEMLKISSHEA